MNYQLIGRPLMAPGMMPVMGGVAPGAGGVIGPAPGGIRPVIGKYIIVRGTDQTFAYDKITSILYC